MMTLKNNPSASVHLSSTSSCGKKRTFYILCKSDHFSLAFIDTKCCVALLSVFESIVLQARQDGLFRSKEKSEPMLRDAVPYCAHI